MATVLAGATVLARVSALAQQGPPNALQGFSTNRDKPVKIRAASLEVRDKEKVATFSGDVHVVQGDTDMRCKTLMVYYEDNSNKDSKETVKAAQPGPGGSGQIRRMEARGNVVVTQKDQTATGDRGDFDMRTNTVVLSGKVVVTKGRDVLRGERLVVNLTDGVSRMEGGQVEALFEPKSKSDQKSEQKSEQKSASGQPAQPARKK
jgi:lipopolysaccharide export system protein LptA